MMDVAYVKQEDISTRASAQPLILELRKTFKRHIVKTNRLKAQREASILLKQVGDRDIDGV